MNNTVIFLAKGFEEIEAVTVIDILRRADIKVTIAGLSSDIVEGGHSIMIVPDKTIDDINVNDFDAIIIPGGNPGYKNLRNDSRVIALIKKAYKSGKIIAAICAAPSVLSYAGILKEKNCTIYPGMEKELELGGSKPKQDLVVIDG
ncbi:MAG: DJ-1/PfpI family protein, partial [Candidatus Bathyarchaeota archaeon]